MWVAGREPVFWCTESHQGGPEVPYERKPPAPGGTSPRHCVEASVPLRWANAAGWAPGSQQGQTHRALPCREIFPPNLLFSCAFPQLPSPFSTTVNSSMVSDALNQGETSPFFQDGPYVTLPAAATASRAPVPPQSRSSNFALILPPGCGCSRGPSATQRHKRCICRFWKLKPSIQPVGRDQLIWLLNEI